MMHRLCMLLVSAFVAVGVLDGYSDGVHAHKPTAGSHVWKQYINVRFQYTICYPEDLFVPQGESENGDGQRFLAKDGAQLIVFARNNVMDEQLKDVLAATALRLAGLSGKVTYKISKANWFAVSGQNGSTVFFAKARYNHDLFQSFELSYDLSRAMLYEPLIDRLSACFADLAR